MTIKYTRDTKTYDMLLATYHPPSDFPGTKVHLGAFRKRIELTVLDKKD